MSDHSNPFAALMAQAQEMAKAMNPALESFSPKGMEKLWPTMPKDIMEMTFGKGFSWITAPSFDAEGVRDIALQRQATEAKGYRTTVAWMDAGSDVRYGDDY